MRRLHLVAAIAALMLVGLLPGNVAAAPMMRFGVYYDPLMLRSNCISGNGPADAAVHVVWMSAGGTVKAIVDVASNTGGGWGYCSASRQLAVGDTIRASSGSYARTFTMPRITLKGNRVTHAFSGIGLPNRMGQLWCCSASSPELVTADGHGRWIVPYGAIGGGAAGINWTTTQGDQLYTAIVVPYIQVTIGGAAVEGGARVLTDVTVKVREPLTNAVRGRANLRADGRGLFSGAFRDGAGNLTDVRVGDRVVSTIASSLDWHVPEVTGEADVVNDFVFGRCFSTEIGAARVRVEVYRAGDERGGAFSGLDADGAFSIDFTQEPDPRSWYNPANLKHGDRIVISCHYETGDIVRFPFRVP